jgi:hypothetical protein
LQIGAIYHFRVVATSAGGSVSGHNQIFTTRWFTPGPTIAPLSVVFSHAWGDYDNDGDLDMAVGTRDPNSGQTAVQLWRNDGGTFSDTHLVLPQVDDTMAWGDYDRDGDLDLVLSGWTRGSYITQVWRNNDGSFADIAAGLPGSNGWVTAWGDSDSDGDLDLVLTGNALPDQPFQLWRNQGGTFHQVPASFPALFNPQAFWADYNQDGALDLLLV